MNVEQQQLPFWQLWTIFGKLPPKKHAPSRNNLKQLFAQLMLHLRLPYLLQPLEICLLLHQLQIHPIKPNNDSGRAHRNMSSASMRLATRQQNSIPRRNSGGTRSAEGEDHHPRCSQTKPYWGIYLHSTSSSSYWSCIEKSRKKVLATWEACCSEQTNISWHWWYCVYTNCHYGTHTGHNSSSSASCNQLNQA